MSKKQKKEIKRKGAENLVRVGKKAASVAANLVDPAGIVRKTIKTGSCVAKGMKRGLSLAEASEACGLMKKVRKPLKLKKPRPTRMTKNIKKVSP